VLNGLISEREKLTKNKAEMVTNCRTNSNESAELIIEFFDRSAVVHMNNRKCQCPSGLL